MQPASDPLTQYYRFVKSSMDKGQHRQEIKSVGLGHVPRNLRFVCCRIAKCGERPAHEARQPVLFIPFR